MQLGGNPEYASGSHDDNPEYASSPHDDNPSHVSTRRRWGSHDDTPVPRMLRPKHECMLKIAFDSFEIIISRTNKYNFKYTQTWCAVAKYNKNDLGSLLFYKGRNNVYGPPQFCPTHRNLYVKVDLETYTVIVKQVDAYSDGRMETQQFMIMPYPKSDGQLDAFLLDMCHERLWAFLFFCKVVRVIQILQTFSLTWDVHHVYY